MIDAFNNDKSYQDFIIEQIAGDSVGADVGTGFLVGGAYDIVKGLPPILHEDSPWPKNHARQDGTRGHL
ncbi:hypothetical protein N9B45_02845 [bacterium]|nr:hypothetical protein [bacterium]